MATKKGSTRKKLEIDSKKLIQMIDSGAPQKEIMDKFGIKNSTQLKVAYANALMESGKVTEIKGGRATAIDQISREISVKKRGSLIIPKNLIAELGFKEGDTFTVKKSKAGITLSRK